MEDITDKVIEQVQLTGKPVNIEGIGKVPNLKIFCEGSDFHWCAYNMSKLLKEDSLQRVLMELSVMVYMEKGILK